MSRPTPEGGRQWPDAESFQRFFEELRPEIEPLMREVTTSEPVLTFWRKLDTGDDYGWDAA